MRLLEHYVLSLRIPFDLPRPDKYRKLLTTRALCSFRSNASHTTRRLEASVCPPNNWEDVASKGCRGLYLLKYAVLIGLYDYIYRSWSSWSLPDLPDIYNPTSGCLRCLASPQPWHILYFFFVFPVRDTTQATTAGWRRWSSSIFIVFPDLTWEILCQWNHSCGIVTTTTTTTTAGYVCGPVFWNNDLVCTFRGLYC